MCPECYAQLGGWCGCEPKWKGGKKAGDDRQKGTAGSARLVTLTMPEAIRAIRAGAPELDGEQINAVLVGMGFALHKFPRKHFDRARQAVTRPNNGVTGVTTAGRNVP
jgi:hypothetical protein